jgi:hypothetical protein
MAEGDAMTSDERRPDEAKSEQNPTTDDDRTGERVYDAFVVRLWREVGACRLLRVEVEHAQSGGTATARGVALGWVAAQIASILGESRAPPDAT